MQSPFKASHIRQQQFKNLTTMNLFKNDKPKKAQRVCRVENLNPEKGVTAMMKVSNDQREYAVVLCLADKTKKTVFHSEFSALEEMKRYRQLYKEIKK